MKKHNKNSGFTIVELLIVIVVISILATITFVAFNGIQARSRDTIRNNDLAQLSKAIKLYSVDNGNYLNSSSSCGNNNGDGNLEFDYDGAGPRKTIMDCLKDGGYINNPIRDPSGMSPNCNGLNCFKYMKYGCGLGVFLYAHLESLPQTSTDTDTTCASTIDTADGVNFFIKFS